MLDIPRAERLDDRIGILWLARHLHLQGLIAPTVGAPRGACAVHRSIFRPTAAWPVLATTRCRRGPFAQTRGHDRPRGSCCDAASPRAAHSVPLARELGLSWKQLHTLRQRMPGNLNETAPTGMMAGAAFDTAARYQHAGKQSTPPHAPPRWRAHQRTGHGTSANDHPPIISVVSRDTGEHRFWVRDHADTRTCAERIAANVPAGRTTRYTDAWPSDRGSHPAHATGHHCMNRSPHNWKEARSIQAWSLKQQGWSQHQIAEALGVSEGAVSQ